MSIHIQDRTNSKKLEHYILVLFVLCVFAYLALMSLQTTVFGSRQETSYVNKNTSTEQLNPLVIFVDETSSAISPDGKSWSTAYPSLTAALESNMFGKEEIWIAKGTYSIKSGADHATRFSLITDIDLYGGFKGSENSREQRNWKKNVTVLTGAKVNENDHFRSIYNIAFGTGVLSIIMPKKQSLTEKSTPEIVLHIARKQCDMIPVL